MQPRNRIIWAHNMVCMLEINFCRHETILWFTKSDKYKFFLDQIRVPQKYQNKKSYSGDTKENYQVTLTARIQVTCGSLEMLNTIMRNRQYILVNFQRI